MSFSRISHFFHRHPVLRGMATYSILYPSSNTVQQYIGTDKINWKESFRFCVFGCFWVAPTLYTWVKVAGIIFPATTISSSVKKAFLEQVMYSPMAITTFYAGMTLLQGKSLENAKEEVKLKFWPTYKVGFLYWPIIQTVNFAFVPEKNRVPVVSVASFLWVSFLSYMKRKKCDFD